MTRRPPCSFVNTVSEGTSTLSSACFSTEQAGMATGLSPRLGPNQCVPWVEYTQARTLTFWRWYGPWLGPLVLPEMETTWAGLAGMGLALNKHRMEGDTVHPGPPLGDPLTSCCYKKALKYQWVSQHGLWIVTGGHWLYILIYS